MLLGSHQLCSPVTLSVNTNLELVSRMKRNMALFQVMTSIITNSAVLFQLNILLLLPKFMYSKHGVSATHCIVHTGRAILWGKAYTTRACTAGKLRRNFLREGGISVGFSHRTGLSSAVPISERSGRDLVIH